MKVTPASGKRRFCSGYKDASYSQSERGSADAERLASATFAAGVLSPVVTPARVHGHVVLEDDIQTTLFSEKLRVPVQQVDVIVRPVSPHD
jgi:hypothetical protein